MIEIEVDDKKVLDCIASCQKELEGQDFKDLNLSEQILCLKTVLSYYTNKLESQLAAISQQALISNMINEVSKNCANG